MSRKMISFIGVAVAMLASSAPAASAADAAALPYCWGAKYGADTELAICAAEESTFTTLTADPQMRTACIIRLPAVATFSMSIGPVIPHPCTLVGTAYSNVDKTGFEPNGETILLPEVSGFSVRWQGQTIGTVFYDGSSLPLKTETLCVGGGCSAADLLSLLAS